jgi:flagellar FliJ protein
MYKFNLEPLLNYRRYQEEILQKELADYRKHLSEAQHKLKSIKQKQRKCFRELHQRQKRDGTVSDLIMYIRYIERLAADFDDQKRRVDLAKKRFNQKREELVEMMKKRKTLEKLKEKGAKAFEQKMLKTDRNFMDEVAAKQHN